MVAEAHAEAAVYSLNWLSVTGTGILLAAIVVGPGHGVLPAELVREYFQTL